MYWTICVVWAGDHFSLSLTFSAWRSWNALRSRPVARCRWLPANIKDSIVHQKLLYSAQLRCCMKSLYINYWHWRKSILFYENTRKNDYYIFVPS